MSENKTSTITLTHSLATDQRAHFDDWLEDAETQARHQCPQHDATGALTLVVTDRVWARTAARQYYQRRPGVSWHPPTEYPRSSHLGHARSTSQQRCCCGRLHLQGRGGQAPGFLHGQQCPHHCPIGRRGLMIIWITKIQLKTLMTLIMLTVLRIILNDMR